MGVKKGNDPGTDCRVMRQRLRVLQERSPNKGQAWDNYWGGIDQQASGSDSLATKASRSNMGA